jgi:hypothetical protein
MKKGFTLGKIGLWASLILSLAACQKDINTSSGNMEQLSGASQAFKSNTNNIEGIIFYALAGSRLDKYSTSNPEKIISSVTITGLQMGETILGIDFRPLTGQLYALGSNSRIYTINPSTGMASFVAALTTMPMGSTTAVPLSLSGTSFAIDFNPVVDRIRIISNTGQNLRVNPTTGLAIVDRPVNPQPASITSAAYTNNDQDVATGTELYAIDASTETLYEINPPNNGTLINPVSIKLKISGNGAFDIAPRNANITEDYALALYEVNKKSTLFRIDLETGETKILAKYNKDLMYTDFAISPSM